MVYALVLGTSGAIRGGSSPLLRTKRGGLSADQKYRSDERYFCIPSFRGISVRYSPHEIFLVSKAFSVRVSSCVARTSSRRPSCCNLLKIVTQISMYSSSHSSWVIGERLFPQKIPYFDQEVPRAPHQTWLSIVVLRPSSILRCTSRCDLLRAPFWQPLHFSSCDVIMSIADAPVSDRRSQGWAAWRLSD